MIQLCGWIQLQCYVCGLHVATCIALGDSPGTSPLSLSFTLPLSFSFRSAKSPPGIAKPFVMGSRKIDDSFKYLVLMTDGVYKSIESTLYEQQSIDPNKLLVRMLERSIDLVRGNFGGVTDNLLERLSKIHKDCYQKNAAKDQRSPLAVACRKRDDMTLLVHKFSN